MKQCSAKWILFLAGFLTLSGCTEITRSNGALILRYELFFVILLLILGIVLFVLGVLLTAKFLPHRWKQQQSLRRKMKSASRLISLPIAGIGIMIAVAPFLWYRVEVGSDYLRLSEFPGENHYRQDQIKSIEIVPGTSGNRLHITIKKGKEHFINESEIGSDSFQTIADSAMKLVKEE
jgi:heme/copper-type cytochrome/quinol oxidase subunit 2